MNKEQTGLAVAVIGAVAFIAAVIKFVVIGYYTSELPLWGGIGLAGGAAFMFGQKMFVAARNEAK